MAEHHQHPRPHEGKREHEEDRPIRAVEIARAQSEEHPTMHTRFGSFAMRSSQIMGSPVVFLIALLVVIVWAALGFVFNFSNGWQLVINTGTTILTFLMVFLVQNTQNRDAKAIHLKLNELIYSLRRAHNELIDVEKLSDEELKSLEEHYEEIRSEWERRHGTHHSSKGDAA